ncbi:MAG: S9 family peptidase, partial [Planctomycetota bacterium]
EGRPGYDNDPAFSPDGTKLAWHSMERAGFESDRNRILVLDLASDEVSEPTAGLDQTVHGATWTEGGDAFVFASEWRGTNQLFRLPLAGGAPAQLTEGQMNFGLVSLLPGGRAALVSAMDMKRPRELHVLDLGSKGLRALTDVNAEHYADLALPTVEERWVEATDGKSIHCWVIKPPGFDPEKKYPLITYCQGGPQGQIGQWFSFRWNFHLMAAQGYVIVAPNRRGLPGFGRAWNDQISGDWGGQAMQDILSATDSMLAEPWVDNERTAAVGASFGGYTVYWLMGNAEDRFDAMIAHCGVFNLESMYGSTEELFFVNHDLGGPYWTSQSLQEKYDRFSPHRFVGQWKTPLLVVHGQRDFRVPVTQGIEAFQAAQIQGVPSRFLYFPDEGHWVLSPQNGVVWHR